jgi:ribonuclease P protein subunit POP4
MKITPSIVQNEFIGLKAKVAHSRNKDLIGISGTIINETRKTFLIKKGNTRKTIIKDIATLHFTLPDTSIVQIEGRTLLGRPEERLKKHIRRLW